MEKYYCDNCGYKIEFICDTMVNKQCTVCKKGYFVYEDTYKENEEIARQIAEDKDDNMTPQEDMNEAVEDFIMEAMQKNIKELGNNGTYEFIERISTAETRIRYRKYFLLSGGQVPEKEPITI